MRENRKIVRRKVPKDVDVMLEESEVHSDGIEVVRITQFADADEFLDLPHRPAKEKRVVHHERQPLALGQLDQFLRLRRRRRERLFDEDVLAVLERPFGELVVGRHRRHDRHRVDVRRGRDVIRIVARAHAGMATPHLGHRFRVLVADGHHFATGLTREVADDVGTPVSVTDDP